MLFGRSRQRHFSDTMLGNVAAVLQSLNGCELRVVIRYGFDLADVPASARVVRYETIVATVDKVTQLICR